MSGTRVVPPSASALISSLRGVGYSLETALADLVDNSISAAATTVEINWEWNGGAPVAVIMDDGTGMSEDRLIEAMRFGCSGSDGVRHEGDLGRFGLGLKTASLSQCRCLTVASRTAAGTAMFTWDADHIREKGDGWRLLEGGTGVSLTASAALARRPSGTAVIWQKIDFGRKEDRPDHAAFMADLERVEKHLGMVFHRFIDGDARSLVITINGHMIAAWDPFLEAHASTIRMPEMPLSAPGGLVRARGFILPHRDRFPNEEDFAQAGGPGGWAVHQGFYIYRQKRLLSAGGWLGLGGAKAWTREEPSRLARIRVDIPNTADQDWRIDIRKAIARPPDRIRQPLQKLAENVRLKAREVFVHRGQYGPRFQNSPVERIWQVNPDGRRRYTIRRDHELVALIRKRIKVADRNLLDALFDLVERTVPVDRVWLDVTEHGAPPACEDADDLFTAAMEMTRMMERAGMPFDEAAAKIVKMDPFDRVEGLILRLLNGKGA